MTIYSFGKKIFILKFRINLYYRHLKKGRICFMSNLIITLKEKDTNTETNFIFNNGYQKNKKQKS